MSQQATIILPKKTIKKIPFSLAYQASALIVCFALSRTAVLGGYAPFGMAAVMALPLYLSPAGTLGAGIGYIIPISGLDPIRYITAVAAILVIKFLLRAFLHKIQPAVFSGFLVFATGMITGLANASVQGFSLKTVIMFAAESLIAAAAAFFFTQAIRIKSRARGYRSLTQAELTCCIISAGAVLLSLSGFTLAGVSPARIFTVLAILSAARYGHERAGAIAGISAGFLMSLGGDKYMFIAAAYALGGLLAGVFAPMKRLGCALAFVLCNVIVAVRVGNTPEVTAVMIEAALASLVFLALPRAVNLRLAEFFAPVPEMPRLDNLRKSITMRLNHAGAALSEVSATVDEVSSRLARIHAPEFGAVFPRVEEEVCKNCGMRIHCWETAKGRTVDVICDLTRLIRRAGRPAADDLPGEMREYCHQSDVFADSVYRHFTDFLGSEAAVRRIDEVRGVVSDQFSGISDMLYDMSEDITEVRSADLTVAERADTALKDIGLNASDIGCTIDKYGRYTIEIRIDSMRPGAVNKRKLREELSLALERDFDTPVLSASGGGALISICERAVFCVDIGVAQYAAAESGLCGDAYEYFNDGRGRMVMVLSDGMGSGGRAAVDGAMASGLTGRLLRAGFGYDCSLKIVNSAMLFKSADESLATIDVAVIDLFSGETELCKAGSGPTIIRKSGKTGIASCQSLPAGILRDIGFDSARVTVGEEDIIIMMSDGATCEGTDWICAEAEKFSGGAQALADMLAQGARRRRSDGREDDITVMAAILTKNY